MHFMIYYCYQSASGLSVGAALHAFVAKNLANSYVYCSRRRYVLRVFDEMAVHNAVSSNSLLASVSSICLNRWPAS